MRDRCQFSWYCDGLVDKPKKGRTWNTSLEVAEIALKKHYADILIDITDGSTHYHANWMEKYPSWAYTKKKMTLLTDTSLQIWKIPIINSKLDIMSSMMYTIIMN